MWDRVGAFVWRWTKLIGFWVTSVTLTWLIFLMEFDGKSIAGHVWDVMSSPAVSQKMTIVKKGAKEKTRRVGTALSIAVQGTDPKVAAQQAEAEQKAEKRKEAAKKRRIAREKQLAEEQRQVEADMAEEEADADAEASE